MMTTLRHSVLLLLCASSVVYANLAGAQAYPVRPIRAIVPFAPGGATDAVMRMIAPRLGEGLGQQVVVENRPGGAATIGMDAVAKSAPDGYTLGMANLTFSINPILLKKMPFDSEKDIALVSHVSILPFLVGVHPSVPARSVKELIALARARPGVLNYSSSGQASATQMATELFKYLTKTDIVHIPFTGGGPALVAVLSGEVSVYWGTIPPLLAHMTSGGCVSWASPRSIAILRFRTSRPLRRQECRGIKPPSGVASWCAPARRRGSLRVSIRRS